MRKARGLGRRGIGTGIAVAATAGAFALAAPSATAGVQAAAVVPTAIVAQVERAHVPSVVGAVDALGRHDVASPQTIGTSALAGAGIGAVVGVVAGALAAPAIGAIVTVGTPILGAALCAGGSAAAVPASPAIIPVCTVLVPLVTAIGAPVATLVSPIVGGLIGAGIGAGIGAAVGSTYVSAPARVPAADHAAVTSSPRFDIAETVPAALPGPVARAVQPTVTAAQPTLDNISLAIDKAIDANPQAGAIADAVTSLLPAQR